MKITEQLKAWLVEHCGVKKDATDAEFKAAAAQALLDGSKLTAEKLVELTADPAAKSAGTLEATLAGLSALVTKMSEGSGSAAGASSAAPAGEKAGGTAEGQKPAEGAKPEGEKAVSPWEKVFSKAGDQQAGRELVRVKGAHEDYSTSTREVTFPLKTQKGGAHPHAGQRAFIGEGQNRRNLDDPSQLQKAIGGKQKLPPQCNLTDHEKNLIEYALHECDWVGTIGGEGDEDNCTHLRKSGQRLSESQVRQVKAVIDDSTSGGLYVAPIFFDEMVILTPILYGEFFPAVNVVPITRGRRIEGGSISVQTISGGGYDATDIPLFTTTSFIAAFNTTIYVANAAIEIGLDFLSDSPVDVAGIVTEQYGRILLNYLDRNIAAGDGTTQPTGITVASGTVSVAGGSAAPTVGVYESFLFGVAKKYKQGYAPERIMFGANETTYQRARAIAVGASDARRVFGMNHESYTIFDRKYGISDTLANTKAFFGNLARYRMYRRLGQTVKVTTEGKTLVRQNTMLLTARSRWGGQPEDGSAFATSSTMQS
jgi:HK97 family phage major capsid protein